MVVVVVKVDGCLWVGAAEEKAPSQTTEGFRRAEGGFGVGLVAYLLAPDSILLVIECEHSVGDALNAVQVIQRCCGVTDSDGDVTESEGLGASFSSGGEEVFGWSHEPVEGDDDEVDDVGVEASPHRVVEVEDVEEAQEDGDVGWVGPQGGAVLVREPLEVSSE